MGWTDSQIVGVMVALETAYRDSEENGNPFWGKIVQKQQQRVKSLYDRHVVCLTVIRVEPWSTFSFRTNKSVLSNKRSFRLKSERVLQALSNTSL